MMAVESLTNYNFSSASDVWSYGILIWEMFNPDKQPDYEIPNDAQVIANIVGGKRLEIPQQCPWRGSASYENLLDIKPHKRPSFLVIASLLQHSMMQLGPVGSK